MRPKRSRSCGTILRVERVNREFINIYGYTPEDAVGQDIRALIGDRTWRKETTSSCAGACGRDGRPGRQRGGGKTERRSKCRCWCGRSRPRAAKLACTPSIARSRQQKQVERLQSALYRIADKASSALDLQELYKAIHGILQELMFAKNCYIAFHDPVTDMVSFPYFVDEKDPQFPPHRFGKGLTEYVLRTGKALLATPMCWMRLVQSRGTGARRVAIAGLDGRAAEEGRPYLRNPGRAVVSRERALRRARERDSDFRFATDRERGGTSPEPGSDPGEREQVSRAWRRRRCRRSSSTTERVSYT